MWSHQHISLLLSIDTLDSGCLWLSQQCILRRGFCTFVFFCTYLSTQTGCMYLAVRVTCACPPLLRIPPLPSRWLPHCLLFHPPQTPANIAYPSSHYPTQRKCSLHQFPWLLWPNCVPQTFLLHSHLRCVLLACNPKLCYIYVARMTCVCVC